MREDTMPISTVKWQQDMLLSLGEIKTDVAVIKTKVEHHVTKDDVHGIISNRLDRHLEQCKIKSRGNKKSDPPPRRTLSFVDGMKWTNVLKLGALIGIPVGIIVVAAVNPVQLLAKLFGG